MYDGSVHGAKNKIADSINMVLIDLFTQNYYSTIRIAKILILKNKRVFTNFYVISSFQKLFKSSLLFNICGRKKKNFLKSLSTPKS